MLTIDNFKKLSFLVYGLGLTGQSVVNFFKKNKIKNYQVWDDKNKNLLKKKRPSNLNQALKNADHIVFIKDGYVLEKGKLEELISKNGEYASLYNQQKRLI